MNEYTLNDYVQDMEELADNPDMPHIIEEGSKYVSKLVSNPAILNDILTKLVLMTSS